MDKTAGGRDPIRVLVVDDSIILRGLFARWIGGTDGIAVVGTARNGHQGLEMVEALNPDVVLLDIDMAETDGLATLPEMLRINPRLSVITASKLTERTADINLKALSLGAKDYLPEPEFLADTAASADFRQTLIGKIVQFGGARPAVRPATNWRPVAFSLPFSAKAFFPSFHSE